MNLFLQVLEEELKKECESCKNYEAQLCKMQVASKVIFIKPCLFHCPAATCMQLLIIFISLSSLLRRSKKGEVN